MSEDVTTSTAATRKDELLQGSLALKGIGEVALVWSPTGLVMLSLPSQSHEEVARDMVDRGVEAPPFAEVPAPYSEVLQAYAAGDAVEPAQLPVDLRGTPFQVKVWNALRQIPRGSVRSYAAIATDVGSPRGMRAVGMASGANPVAIVVPCHRVVETGLRLGGFSGGLPMKRTLLALEGVSVDGGRVAPGQLDLWEMLAK